MGCTTAWQCLVKTNLCAGLRVAPPTSHHSPPKHRRPAAAAAAGVFSPSTSAAFSAGALCVQCTLYTVVNVKCSYAFLKLNLRQMTKRLHHKRLAPPSNIVCVCGTQKCKEPSCTKCWADDVDVSPLLTLRPGHSRGKG